MPTETTPLVSGHPATKCDDPECCMCKGTFAEAFCEWICPYCKAHLSKEGRVCLNLCGMSVPMYQKFQSALVAAYHKDKP